MDRQAIFSYVHDVYGVTPDYPWEKDDAYAVLRHTGPKGKWFGLIMDLPCRVLGLPGEGKVDAMNVKGDPVLIASLKNMAGYRPAYHMNKEHWLTILLDGTVPDEQICMLLDMSFELTK